MPQAIGLAGAFGVFGQPFGRPQFPVTGVGTTGVGQAPNRALALGDRLTHHRRPQVQAWGCDLCRAGCRLGRYGRLGRIKHRDRQGCIHGRDGRGGPPGLMALMALMGHGRRAGDRWIGQQPEIGHRRRLGCPEHFGAGRLDRRARLQHGHQQAGDGHSRCGARQPVVRRGLIKPTVDRSWHGAFSIGRSRFPVPHCPMTQPLLHTHDLRGLARLTTEAVTGLASLVEAMHARIASPPRLPFVGGAGGAGGAGSGAEVNERTRGITGLVYRSVGGITRIVGGSAEVLLGLLEPLLTDANADQPQRAERAAVLAALNGVLGDHLAASQNPLAIAMTFHHDGLPLALEKAALRASMPHAGPRPLVLIHGLCMNHLQWRRDGHDHGQALARELGYTPVYLHYNSGLNIVRNGQLLALQMQRLVDAWPVPIERLVLLGHSMGGLVARSALHHDATQAHGSPPWSTLVNDLVCLGSPHQGAPLERAGHGIDRILSAAPYAAPLARLGKVRSAGINDLRRGNILGVTQEGAPAPEHHQPRMPEAVRCYALAGCLGPTRQHLKTRLLGDGLVPVESALGHHADPERRVNLDPQRQAVVDATGHLDLLSSPAVYAVLKRWLS